jgi:hypothetical protein
MVEQLIKHQKKKKKRGLRGAGRVWGGGGCLARWKEPPPPPPGPEKKRSTNCTKNKARGTRGRGIWVWAAGNRAAEQLLDQLLAEEGTDEKRPGAPTENPDERG